MWIQDAYEIPTNVTLIVQMMEAQEVKHEGRLPLCWRAGECSAIAASRGCRNHSAFGFNAAAGARGRRTGDEEGVFSLSSYTSSFQELILLRYSGSEVSSLLLASLEQNPLREESKEFTLVSWQPWHQEQCKL